MRIAVILVVCLGIITSLSGYFGTTPDVVRDDTKPSPTPCATIPPPTNIYDPCNPPPTVDPALMADTHKRYETLKAKLFDAKFPLTNQTLVDVDGDGRNDKIFYRVQPWRDDFEGRLTITSANKRELWNHEFFMSSRDLTKFLTEVLDYENVETWVSSVFKEKAPYAFKAENKKLKTDVLDEEQLKHAAKIHKISFDSLKSEILDQPTNHVFSYRAEWREDLMLLVYVPSLKAFVCFSRGY